MIVMHMRTCPRSSLQRAPISFPVPWKEFAVMNCRKAGMSCAVASRSCEKVIVGSFTHQRSNRANVELK